MYKFSWRTLLRPSDAIRKEIIREACKDTRNVRPAINIGDDIIKSESKIESYLYCLNHVKKYDRENYLAALCIDHDLIKRGVLALRAFNVELSLVRDSTTNSDRAKIRFHFWSKLVDEIVRRNDHLLTSEERLHAYHNHTPVARELIEIFHFVDVDKTIQDKLRDLIGSRLSSKVLGYKQFEDVKDLELYCSKSNGSIYHLSVLFAINLRNDWASKLDFSEELGSMSEDLGVAQGLMNIIRGIHYNATKNCCYIPRDLLEANNLTTRDFMGNRLQPDKLTPVIKQLAGRSQELVTRVYQTSREIPDSLECLFLPCITIQAYLKKLRRCNYNICDRSLNQRDKLLPFNLWMASKFFRVPLL